MSKRSSLSSESSNDSKRQKVTSSDLFNKFNVPQISKMEAFVKSVLADVTQIVEGYTDQSFHTLMANYFNEGKWKEVFLIFCHFAHYTYHTFHFGRLCLYTYLLELCSLVRTDSGATTEINTIEVGRLTAKVAHDVEEHYGHVIKKNDIDDNRMKRSKRKTIKTSPVIFYDHPVNFDWSKSICKECKNSVASPKSL